MIGQQLRVYQSNFPNTHDSLLYGIKESTMTLENQVAHTLLYCLQKLRGDETL